MSCDDGWAAQSVCLRLRNGLHVLRRRGVDAIVDYSQAPEPESGTENTNTCLYARDGVCVILVEQTIASTDCQDCGPLGADNFTRAEDDDWWDDDDNYWTLNDGNFL